MSADDYKVLARRYFLDGANKGDLSVFDEVFDADFVGHDPAVPDSVDSLEQAKIHFANLRQAFPNLEFRITDQVADENNVVTRWVAHATHTGSYYGMPPTGK